MQSDTLVGIVGAVVLVAVMVGVFAYEYNNVDDGGDSTPTTAAMMQQFNETYPALVAMEDMDGDGVPNYQDMDLDGDGIDNGNDTDLKIEHSVTGSVGAANPATGRPTQSFPFPAGTGLMHVELFLSGGTSAGGTVVSALEVQVTTPAGDTFTAPGSAAGNTVNYSLTLEDSIGPGTYTVTVRAPQASAQATAFSGTLTFHYVS